MPKNRYGLSRYIPSPIKREIRQRDGFGCVICGCGFYDYEHVDPEFADAKEHNPNCMTLLCMQHNQKKNRGLLSKKTVKRHMLNPRCKKIGFTYEFFDIGEKIPIIQFGNSSFNVDDNFTLFQINGVKILRFEKPKEKGSPFLLSATFFDNEGQRIFEIKRNRWFGISDIWDIEVKGTRIIIRKGKRNIALKINNIPHDRLIIEQIDMTYEGYRIFGNDKESISIYTPKGASITTKSCNSSLKSNGRPIIGYLLGKNNNQEKAFFVVK